MHALQALAALLTVAATVTAQFPTCEADCKSCGLACSQGCDAPLVPNDCQDCVYCRRESSSCSNFQLGGQEPSAHCQTCYSSCQCRMVAVCYDDLPPVTTSSGTAPPAAATKPLVPGGNDLFGRRFGARARA
ncbi:hypothetical protein PG985_002304 [Apiospora marii]|uniref:4Fe-4S ferredoxin-type domain-containing protein n=1 Tax=Apiospora marii TaxID=335849 RepID=A0ABR1RSH6_9PEZI